VAHDPLLPSRRPARRILGAASVFVVMMAVGAGEAATTLPAGPAAAPAVAQAANGPMQRVQYPGPGRDFWVDASGGSIPPGSFTGGREGAPGFEDLFICRAMVNGSLAPGKVRPGLGACDIPFGGAEVRIANYQVLVSGNFAWVAVQGGFIPPHAVRGGYDVPPQSPPLFVCQAPYQGGIHPGKTRPDWNTCNIGWGGKEISLRRYAVLVR
jgi:uncharacterized protein DUF3421